MKVRRVQGSEFKQLRKEHRLKLLCISASKNNNWRADMIDENGRHYSHWLDDTERDRLMQSTYFDTHKIVDSDDLYNPQSEVYKLLVKRQEANLSAVPCFPLLAHL
jgi:hypothetical protein